MEESLRTLKEIGAQQIHKDTHISLEYVQSIIHGSFEGLNSVQFKGFISILEKEYGVDLREVKEKGKEYFREIEGDSQEIKKVFVAPEKQTSNSAMYIWAGLIVFVAAAYYSFGYLSSMATVEPKIDNSQIEDAKKIAIDEEDEKTMAATLRQEESELNNNLEVKEELKSEVVEEEIQVQEVEEVVVETVATVEVKEEVVEDVKTLKILPKRRIWAGYIDIKTNQKFQKVFKKEFPLDTEKDWLLLFGKGTVYLEVNGKKEKFSSNQNMRFKYVDGVFTKITVTEFKSLNKGRKW